MKAIGRGRLGRRLPAVLLALKLLTPALLRAQDAAGETYADPAGRFTVPVPTG